jgi:hypothetical protein
MPKWADRLIDSYFDNWPHEEISKLYKDHGFKCLDYFTNELDRIFNATIRYTDDLPCREYYLEKYPGTCIRIRDMDIQDKTIIFRTFTTQLGIHWDTFPISLEKDILK